MTNSQINRINRARNIVDIINRIFINDNNDDNGLNAWNNDICDRDSQARFADRVLQAGGNDWNCDDGTIRVWLSQCQMDNDADTWRGINRVFRLGRRDFGILRRANIITNDFFDDGTLHIDLDAQATADAINNAMSDQDVDWIISRQQSIADDANRIIDLLDGNDDD